MTEDTYKGERPTGGLFTVSSCQGTWRQGGRYSAGAVSESSHPDPHLGGRERRLWKPPSPSTSNLYLLYQPLTHNLCISANIPSTAW